MKTLWQELAVDLFLYAADTCNVYLLRYGNRAIAIDFGTGAWIDHIGAIGIERVEHIVLTHAHRE